MKKISSLFLLAFTFYFYSCAPKEGGHSEKVQKNIDAMTGVGKAFETKDFSRLGDYIADDAVDHAGEQGDVKGLANIKAEYQKMASMTEGDKMTTIRQFADDDYGVSWIQFAASMKTGSMGMKAGQKFDMKSMEVTKFRDGKIIEHWTYMDPAEMMKMMMPDQSQMPMPIDSTKGDSLMKH